MRSGFVGLVFARSRDCQLNQHGGDGSEKEHQQSAKASAAIVAVTFVSAKDHSPARNLGEVGDSSGDGGRNRTDQDVAIANVAEFVGQYAFEFFVGEQSRNSVSHRD